MRDFLQTEQLVAVNPLEHPKWDEVLASHSESCFFHGTSWARVLQQTYGHRPFYLCRFSDDRLCALLPIMEVSSRLTGRRGVSLPFSDFSPVIKTNEQDAKELFDRALDLGRTNGWKYFESRAEHKILPGAIESVAFYSHRINLDRPTGELMKSFDDSVRRGIRKAEKAGLKIEFSETGESMNTFYSLHCRTRRRHGLPPQPPRFFENIARYVLKAGQGFVATALLDQQPVAAAVFFHNKRQLIYKFGASNFSLQHLRANNLLFSKTIEHCAEKGFQEMHLGRTSLSNEGLRRFKLGFGASEEKVAYTKYDFAQEKFVVGADRAESWVNGIFRCFPLPVLRFAGHMIYPHLS